MATDPVCGMTVNPESAKGSHEYRGQTYYFCNTGCRDKFRRDPAALLLIAPLRRSLRPPGALNHRQTGAQRGGAPCS